MTKEKLNTAVILCGGKSKRMGFDKQTITLDGQLIALDIAKKLKTVFEEIIIVTNRPELYRGSGYKVTKDHIKGFGPLAGIHAGLVLSQSSHAYVTAGDMPFIETNYVRRMVNQVEKEPSIEVLVTKDRQGHIEPFNGFYGKAFLPAIEKAFKEDVHKIIDIYNSEKTHYMAFEDAVCFSPDWSMFSNLNTEKDCLTIQLKGKELGVYEDHLSSGLLQFG